MKSFNSELKLNPGLKSNLKPHQINWMLDMGKQWSFKLTRNLTISTAEQKRAWYWHKAPETSHRLMICIIHSGIFFLKNKQTRNYLDGLSKEAIKSWCMKATMLALKGQAIIWHLWERPAPYKIERIHECFNGQWWRIFCSTFHSNIPGYGQR